MGSRSTSPGSTTGSIVWDWLDPKTVRLSNTQPSSAMGAFAQPSAPMPSGEQLQQNAQMARANAVQGNLSTFERAALGMPVPTPQRTFASPAEAKQGFRDL